MTVIATDRKFKLVKYAKGYSVDFDDMPVAYYEDYQEALDKFERSIDNWYGDIQ